LGANIAVAKTKKHVSGSAVTMIDRTIAFDMAEVATAHLGQTNMMTVSSFCGPNGLIWGHDVCADDSVLESIPGLEFLHDGDRKISIHSMDGLEHAFSSLTGSVAEPRFPFLPGTHLPCALKTKTVQGKTIIYAAFGIGIPEDRDRHACLLMEDVDRLEKHGEKSETTILEEIGKSILEVGRIQNVKYEEMYLGIKSLEVDEGEVGCAMVASPYFALAQDAYPESTSLMDLKLSEWEAEVGHKFLFKT